MGNLKYHVRWDFLTFCSDEERDSYFLGFFYADGNNCDASGSISLKLQEQDRDFLQKLSNSIYSTPRELNETIIPEYASKCAGNKYYSLFIGCRGISKKLTQLGAPPRKTYVLKYPCFLNKEQERHFIRGYFDGDGCCSESLSEKRRVKTRNIIICGNLEFLEGMKTAIFNYTGIEAHIRQVVGIHDLRIGGNRQVLKFLMWIYEGANFFLPRKMDRYRNLQNDLMERDSERDGVIFIPKKNRWRGRLPAKFGRKSTGIAKTYEEALKLRIEALTFLETHSLQEWIDRPKKKWRKFNQNILNEAHELVKQDMPLKEIALKLGMAFITLKNRLQEDGVKIEGNKVVKSE